MDNQLYATINTSQERVKSRIKDFIMQNLIFIVLFFNIVLNIVSKLYNIGFQNPFSVEFFLNLSVSIATSMLTYALFIPFGKNNEKLANPSYKANVSFWGELSDLVRSGYNSLFGAFCKAQLDVEREDKKRAIICNNTLISYEEYLENYKGKTKLYIKTLVNQGKLTRKEARAINRANGNAFFNHTKVRPINPVLILSGVRKSQLNDCGRADGSYAMNRLFSRPFVIFATNVLINTITTSFAGGAANAIFDMFLSVLLIVMASVCGYSTGVTSVRRDNDNIKNRILFLSLFCEKNDLKLPKNGSKINTESTKKP